MTVLVAPDSFKGSLRADEAAAAMAAGVHDVFPDARTLEHPVSDGGEGLVDVLVPVLDGTMMVTRVHGPLPHQFTSARWGFVASRSLAVLEMAQAAGLHLVPPDARDPRLTTTYGVGELILAALDHGAREILLGIGGSATNDGGAGMAEALGVRFLDDTGEPLAQGGGNLGRLDRINRSGLDPRLARTRIVVACDVRNPLTGPDGASVVYGPQKGATPDIVDELDRNLTHYGSLINEALEEDVAALPGAGAAGGLGAGLVAFCGAVLRSGIEIVLDSTGFDERLRMSDLVVTGEGAIDAQTAFGKALAGVLGRARGAGVPVIAVAGLVRGDRSALVGSDGFRAVTSLVDEETPPEAAMARARELIRRRTAELLRTLETAAPGFRHHHDS